MTFDDLTNDENSDNNLRLRAFDKDLKADTDEELVYSNCNVTPADQKFLDLLPEKTKVVGIEGIWYDVTDFIARHPGGPIIEKFIGQDATEVFNAYRHPPNILKTRRKVGTYTQIKRHPADQEFRDLVKKFENMGFYRTDFFFYIRKLSVNIMILLTSLYLVIGCNHWSFHYLGGAVLALFWQQCGFIMHEAMHGQIFKNRFWDHFAGLVIGSMPFGISSHWWHDEHVIHHGMTNVVDVATRFVDPQMWEETWAQDKRLYPLFQSSIHWMFIKIQHITFVPFVVAVGRFEILLDGYRQERRWYEILFLTIHWVCMFWLLSWLPTWREVIIFYLIAANVEGIFHFQLILSHYCRHMKTMEEFHSGSWYEFQMMSNMNIDTYRWLWWFYGGLNFHIEHHLFPRMNRNNLSKVAPYVKELCDKHGIEYLNVSFFEAIKMTILHLKKAGTHFKLDPR